MEIIKRNKTVQRASFIRAYNKLESALTDDSVEYDEIEMCLEWFKQKVDSLEITHNGYLEGLEDEQDFENQFITVEEYREKSLRIQLRAKRALEHLKKITKENKTAFTNYGSQLQHQNRNITVVSLMSQKLPVPNRSSRDHITIPQSELSKLNEESVKTKITFEQKLSELQKKNEELLSDVKKRNIALKEKEEIKIHVMINNFNLKRKKKDEVLLDLQNQLKTKEIEINSSSQAKKLDQELDEMMENDEELKILHEKLFSSKKSQRKSSELNKLLMITEKNLQPKESETYSLKIMVKGKEYQFDKLSQMIDESLKQFDWTNIRRAFEANQT
ncbi:uncharacterized protein TNCV_4789521 [Trichonephila clavipes]|nr:uncharacterized protein TNCV_4789521 [Trichonephila clavipes]